MEGLLLDPWMPEGFETLRNRSKVKITNTADAAAGR